MPRIFAIDWDRNEARAVLLQSGPTGTSVAGAWAAKLESPMSEALLRRMADDVRAGGPCLAALKPHMERTHGLASHLLLAAVQVRQFSRVGIEQEASRLAARHKQHAIHHPMRATFYHILHRPRMIGHKDRIHPHLLRRRCELASQRDGEGELVREVLLGDDAEADAFVYSLYADVCEGKVDPERLRRLFGQVQLLRAVNPYGFISIHRFYIYAEQGLSRQRVSIWIAEGQLHIEYRETLLARYRCARFAHFEITLQELEVQFQELEV